MRIKHYLLIMLTMLVIAFLQPLVVFLGNLAVILAAGAYIYSDLPASVQDHYERRIARGLAELRHLLRRNQPALSYQQRPHWVRSGRPRAGYRD